MWIVPLCLAAARQSQLTDGADLVLPVREGKSLGVTPLHRRLLPQIHQLFQSTPVFRPESVPTA